MSKWFAGISQAASSIGAARRGLTVVSQNIAKADTPGYTRQASVHGSAGVGTATGGTTVGGGTNLDGVNGLPIKDADDPALDARVRVEHARSANADATASALGAVEGLFPEPGSDGLAGQFSDFWSAWGTVANDPGSASSRSVLLEKAHAIAATLHIANATMDDVVTSISDDLNQNATSANDVAGRLADLNGLICSPTTVGADADPLLDQRDQLADQLSSLVGGSATLNEDGTATITVGGVNLVGGTTASSVTVDRSFQVSIGGTAVSVGESSIGAESTLLTATLPQYKARLDGVADALKSAVNGIQGTGYDQNGAVGADLFSGSGAAGISVTTKDPKLVAASGSPGANLDGSNALRASREGSASDSPDSAYATLLGSVATASASAQQQQSLQDAVVTSVNNLKSSVYRVTYDQEVSNIELAQTQLAKLQQQLSSGNRITTPSDDPAGTVTALRTRAELSRNSQYATNCADALGWLSAAHGTYSQSFATLQQARTLVVEALNTAASDSTSRNAIASELAGLRTALLSLANTTYNGRPLFGGTTANGAAFAADGTYQGDAGQVTRAIGAGSAVTVSAVGSDVFGGGSGSVFSLLQNLSSAISSGATSATLHNALSDIADAISRISTAQSTEGAAYEQVQRAQTVGTTEATALKTRLSAIEDVDRADLAVKVTTANATYQAALQTTANIGQLSLLDFLR